MVGWELCPPPPPTLGASLTHPAYPLGCSVQRLGNTVTTVTTTSWDFPGCSTEGPMSTKTLQLRGNQNGWSPEAGCQVGQRAGAGAAWEGAQF